MLGQTPHQTPELAQLVAKRLDLPLQLIQLGGHIGALLLLGFFAFVGQFIFVALTPAFGPLASRRRRTKQSAGTAAAKLVPHRDVNHDGTMMGIHAERPRTGVRARTGTRVRARTGVAGVFRTGVMLGVLVMLAMFAARMPVSVMFATSLATSLAMTLAAMSIAMMFMAAMGVAMVFMAAMRITVVAARMMLAMIAMAVCMLSISIAVCPRLSMPFAAIFMTTLALTATAALAAIIVIVVFVLFFVAALTVVIAEGEQMHINISLLGLDRHACLGRRHFACQGPQHGQFEVTQKIGRA